MAKNKIIIIILTACAVFGMLVIVSCAGFLYTGFNNADTFVSPRIDAMFSAIENGTFTDTYETECAQELRDAATKDQYEAIGKTIATRLGSLKIKKLQGFHLRRINADSYVDVVYVAIFEKGSGTVKAKLKKQGGYWKFVSFNVDSPVF